LVSEPPGGTLGYGAEELSWHCVFVRKRAAFVAGAIPLYLYYLVFHWGCTGEKAVRCVDVARNEILLASSISGAPD
jgi:hypothetical protein